MADGSSSFDQFQSELLSGTGGDLDGEEMLEELLDDETTEDDEPSGSRGES